MVPAPAFEAPWEKTFVEVSVFVCSVDRFLGFFGLLYSLQLHHRQKIADQTAEEAVFAVDYPVVPHSSGAEESEDSI